MAETVSGDGVDKMSTTAAAAATAAGTLYAQ